MKAYISLIGVGYDTSELSIEGVLLSNMSSEALVGLKGCLHDGRLTAHAGLRICQNDSKLAD